MCNLYTFKLSREEVRHLLAHYKLIGKEWGETFGKEMDSLNASGDVYPKYTAPVVIEHSGEQILDHMRWGMPGPVIPGEKSTRPKFS